MNYHEIALKAYTTLRIGKGLNRPGQPFDEVAVIFSDLIKLATFVHICKAVGFEHFNSVRSDSVYPNDSDPYEVRYEFLRVPYEDWRIEAMVILDGASPVHDGLPDGSLVHLSWKCGNEEDYIRQCNLLKPRKLAEMTSSYGAFTYFGQIGEPPYLKPRWNRRDDAT